MPLVLTRDDREILTGNRLKVVVAQAKFPPIHALNSPQGVAGFQEVIRDRYPISEERSRQVTLRMSSAGVESDAAQPGPWRFLTEDGAWIVALSADSLSLETTSYRAYEDFRRRAAELFLLVAEVIRPARLERFGMRFLNELALPGVSTLADWRPYLGEDLLGLGRSGELSDHVTFALQQLNLELDDGKIIFKHGYVPRAGNEDAPSVYVIDIDTFDDRPAPFEKEGILSRMDTYNVWAWSLFRANVRDELVEQLRAQAR